MLKIIAGIIVVLIAAVLGYAAMQPDSFRVERSIVIKAPAEKIFAEINDFHRWEAWSPWEKIDPAVKRSYSGAEQGLGAVYSWEGNDEIGMGNMQIVESLPPSKLLLDIEFISPFSAKNKVEFTLVENGDATTVTQSMYGPSPYLSKLVGVFFNMDKMVGEKYEEGLASLKTIAEK